jgi:hypothetical protein
MDKALTPLMSSCEEAVIAKIRLRQKAGLTKYGVTMERTDLTHAQWLNHLQEELLDAAVYIEKLLSLPGHLGADAPLVKNCLQCQNGQKLNPGWECVVCGRINHSLKAPEGQIY